MNNAQFSEVMAEQIQRCEDVLIIKNKEYSSAVDRLHNFKRAAELQMTTQRNACAGIMIKHIISIYDMCRSPDDFSMALWNEKITDAMNYLFLLRAIVEEDKDVENS